MHGQYGLHVEKPRLHCVWQAGSASIHRPAPQPPQWPSARQVCAAKLRLTSPCCA